MLIYNLVQKCYRAFYKIKTRYWYGIFLSECGKNNSIIKPIILTPKFIFLKNDILIRDNCRVEAVSAYMDTNYTPQIIINDHVSIEQNLHLTCAGKITIGSDTAIAANVTITDINHPYTDITLPPEKQPLQVSEVFIGEACKIYNNVVILPGTVLGKHNVVGANSVVGGIFPDYCVIAGVPARILKRYNIATNKWEKVDATGSFKQATSNN
jgi:acetyltransferase-like isoleucine patch superfamily enzyme